MTPDPPSSADGTPLPKRHRPSLGNLAQDTTEMDLWAFDDDLELDDAAPPDPPPSAASNIPAPRAAKPAKKPELSEGGEMILPVAKDRIRIDVNKPKFKGRSGSTSSQSKPESEFDELDHWEDLPPQVEIGELPADDAPIEIESGPVARILPVPELPAAPEEAVPVDAPVGASVEALADVQVEAAHRAAPEAPATSEDEFTPVVRPGAVPISLRPHLGLTKLERVGLGSLLGLLLAAVISFVAISLNRLPTESAKAQSNDFPIKGAHMVIVSAESYWRAPLMEGPAPDTVRRGTALIPVLELKVGSANGAIRVLFRNEDRSVVGDAVTRSVQGSATLKIPATAGFDDPGMHAAYRTGGTKPWTIEVFEAPSESTAGREFKKLFEMHISAARR
jgi:hypothetical protein